MIRRMFTFLEPFAEKNPIALTNCFATTMFFGGIGISLVIAKILSKIDDATH